ncbi:RluA family pseudouridine synthase [Gilvimarinus polysaccharolyticus]|uniref:RluA family pseudouridine synthase n=1 Tax=Gilvimarinus polysaccharolyticus TaxID=863921 RepID=UPI0006734C09|nr:pseudouridine synthase [Gilvimarinus polysaccharolyticus]
MQPQADPFIAPVCTESIEILYQDNAILLINKPSGLLSLSGKHPANKDSVHFRLVQDFADARLLHRLDLGTSGVMLVALNKIINGVLTKQFQAQSINKTYTAILQGHITPANGSINAPIAKGEFPLQEICYSKGKAAHTKYQLLGHESVTANNGMSAPCSRVLYTPLTGRTHQLRIHSRELGHPILGCDLYANDTAYFMARRLMLHATSLTFDHPITGERINATSRCPF